MAMECGIVFNIAHILWEHIPLFGSKDAEGTIRKSLSFRDWNSQGYTVTSLLGKTGAPRELLSLN